MMALPVTTRLIALLLPSFLLGFLNSCTTTSSHGNQMGDRAVTIITLDLFSQVEMAKGARSWLGDWEFRRDRLEMVDSALRDLRPDLAVFQNAMRRAGSISEDDSLILKAGAMARYEWRDVGVQQLSESGETRNLAVAVPKPSSIEAVSQKSEQGYWALGADGFVAVFRVVGWGDPVLVFNVVMPSRLDQAGLWYSFIKERILETVASGSGCLDRVVVAGFLPLDPDNRRAEEFMRALQLKDSATGFCQSAVRCQTATQSNGVFAAVRSDSAAGQMDRILISNKAQVISSELAFTTSRATDRYKEMYQLPALWPAQRYGWSSKIRLRSCGR